MPDIKTIDEKLDEILVILNGNGKVGMCAKVEILWKTSIVLVFIILTQAVILTRILMT